MRLTLFAACLAALALPAAGADGCGTPDGRCQTGLGVYRLVLPQGAEAPVPALLYLHGWGGSAEGVMRNEAMTKALADRGYALIAPQGRARASHPNTDWSVRDGEAHPRDDVAFLTQVLDDAARHGVDRDRVLVAGFSRGGSMAWDLACRAPGAARAYAPVAGAFWEPMPERCAGPVDLFHTHGWTDRTVPLEGRAVAGGQLVQGELWASLALLRETNGCAGDTADVTAVEPGRWLRRWTCPGGRIDLMLHPGGHGLPFGWLNRALDLFESLEE